MKKIIFIYHPFSDGELGLTVESYFKKKFDSRKKLYLIQYLINNANNKIKTIFFLKRKKIFFFYFIQIIKLYFWAYINNLKLANIRFTANVNKLKKGTFFYANARSALKYDPAVFLKNSSCTKLFNLSHFEVETSIISKNAKDIGVDYFVFENNLSKNSQYFKYFFPYYKKDTFVLPHVYNKRFKNFTNFNNRKNLCFASGRVILFDKKKDFNYKDFIDYFKINYQHKIRYEIYNSKNKDKYINSYISLKDSSKTYDQKSNLKIKENYYSKFNIVDMYNKHKMFIAPEGINDTPPIGFVEGMSCGSALLALDNNMYSDLGLKKNIHYIDYDGSIEDLIDKIKFFQKNNSQLEKIANNGYNFAINNFNSEKISLYFINFLKSIKFND